MVDFMAGSLILKGRQPNANARNQEELDIESDRDKESVLTAARKKCARGEGSGTGVE